MPGIHLPGKSDTAHTFKIQVRSITGIEWDSTSSFAVLCSKRTKAKFNRKWEALGTAAEPNNGVVKINKTIHMKVNVKVGHSLPFRGAPSPEVLWC